MKICVGLSGGVDSSVAALLLKRQGFDVFAMFMQNWNDASSTLHGECEWEEDKFVAEMVARKLEIPFYFVDLSAEYRRRVVDYMFGEYEKGRTPNPDVLCNREIKFDAFLKVARAYGADMVATGHYCRKEELDGPGGEKVFRILEGVDPGKDQSYFLCQLTQEQLSRSLFPIGGLLKKEVRALAQEAGLPSADKKDSQGICFVGKVDLPVFLQQKLKSTEGDVVEILPPYYESNSLYLRQKELVRGLLREGFAGEPPMISHYISEDKCTPVEDARPFDAGRVESLPADALGVLSAPLGYEDVRLETERYKAGRSHEWKTRYVRDSRFAFAGRHEGAQFYTIGQRKGLNIGGHREPLFVLSTDIRRNMVFVGEGHASPGLSRLCLKVEEEGLHWIRPETALPEGGSMRAMVRIRYRQPLQDATLLRRGGGLYIFFDQAQRGITAGQFAVWYVPAGTGPQDYEMAGSGVIEA